MSIALKDLAKQMLSDFRPLKEPSIRRERTTVEVKLHQPPRSAQLRALSDQFEELTDIAWTWNIRRTFSSVPCVRLRFAVASTFA